ncbi:MAG: sulfatase-like hydrolase/transferase [Candidatus Lokiarchaeota archaeon]|nr:sulfatase-like hydrolase/transferase [Candidatus Lokiarchaeota archaeon]
MSEKKPNILIIITDQQNSRMMSCTGNANVNTPALDRLAKNGVRFDQALCTNPVCVPARFSLFTGLRPSEIKLRCNEDARVISKVSDAILANGMGHLLQKAEYKTFYGGKEHFPTFKAKDIGFTYFTRDERDQLARESAEFLKKEHDQPFLLVISFINPHDVCYMTINDYRENKEKQRTGKFKKLLTKLGLDRKRVELRNVLSLLEETENGKSPAVLPDLPKNHEPQTDEPEGVRSLFKRKFRGYARESWNELKWRQHRYIYAKLTEKVDEKIGQVLDALQTGPNSENTVVIFTSDHGDHDASHKLEHKTAQYVEAVEVPFLIKWNHVLPKGRVVKNPISVGLDLLPTVCEIADIKVAANNRFTGRSILPLIKADIEDTERWIPIECEVGRGIWGQDWAYVLYDEGTHREQLYNLKEDPGQTKNYKELNPDILEECREKFAKLYAEKPSIS